MIKVTIHPLKNLNYINKISYTPPEIWLVMVVLSYLPLSYPQILIRFKDGSLQLQTYFVTAVDFKDISENCA